MRFESTTFAANGITFSRMRRLEGLRCRICATVPTEAKALAEHVARHPEAAGRTVGLQLHTADDRQTSVPGVRRWLLHPLGTQAKITFAETPCRCGGKVALLSASKTKARCSGAVPARSRDVSDQAQTVTHARLRWLRSQELAAEIFLSRDGSQCGLRWNRRDGKAKKENPCRFTISPNLSVTRRCFHQRVVRFSDGGRHPRAPTVAGDRGYLAPLRRGLFLNQGDAQKGTKFHGSS